MAKVMVVDDAAFMRQILKEILTNAGYEIVAEASNGIEAVNLFRQVKPDLITMDISMPEMDGIQALTKIKRLDPQAQIIICSTLGHQNIVVDAIHAGAVDFIIKPFQKDRVIEAVRKCLSQLNLTTFTP